ncbi:hypothetical protein [Paenibacillus hexagrammi]|uniref:Uncharacterized protein n=1 Tax=Paenibacillus hexagrammi TaxID=2908839 RepID=A0ABY3SEX2_9BACL|nr:hypothetical protein [Paenibacillus sp. YPD9-1]UJF31467.1 hypothetical protein L0M14_16735 [Paenibacillus sp. YPD9-1]
MSRTGCIRIYAGSGCIAEHERSAGRHQLVMNRKHNGGYPFSLRQTYTSPMPRFALQETPQVVERKLSIYEQFLEEAVLQWSLSKNVFKKLFSSSDGAAFRRFSILMPLNPQKG